MKWDYTVGNDPCGDDSDVVLKVKDFFHGSLPFLGSRRFQVALHAIMKPDASECFHTHPAWAVRVILSGGYWEQVWVPDQACKLLREWKPGDVGLVAPAFCHRVDSLRDGPSYSLWIRGRCTEEIHLVGRGWEGRVIDEVLALDSDERRST